MEDENKKEEITTLQDAKSTEEDPKEKRIKELEKQLGEQAEELGKQKEFSEGATSVLNTVYYNEELRKHFQDVYKKQYGDVQADKDSQKDGEKKPNNDGDVENKRLATEIGEVKMSQRERLIADFEDKVGVSRMSQEEQKKIRSDISGVFSTFGQTINTVPLSSLSTTLDKAYTTIRAEKMKEEGKIEGFTKARQNAQAYTPSMSSGEIPDSEDKKLND